METNQYPEHTEKCKNFKDYLAREFKVQNFGNFVCAYKFSLVEINALVAAANDHTTAAAIRVYYGCNAQGDNHRLFLAVLDENDAVLVAQPLRENQTQSATEATTATDPTKCPPGCRLDAIVGSLL